MSDFKLVTHFEPTGDQPAAIEKLTRNLLAGKRHHVLLGVTGSGKTFTMAQVIARINKPTLIAPNKTLAAQLYNEFKQLFPENAVEYFVSYYDYYQPEAYIPSSDTYIQKDSSINEMIDKLRHSATRSVLSRRDVVVVASVSCIFGLGLLKITWICGLTLQTTWNSAGMSFFSNWSRCNMNATTWTFTGAFSVRGDRVEVFPAYEEDRAIRVDFFGDQVEAISEIDALRGTVIKRLKHAVIFPASHYVTGKTTLKKAVETIIEELKERIEYFRDENKLIEVQRIEERTHFDLEMIQELGYCNGIENYSRHLTGRKPGEPRRPCWIIFRMIFCYSLLEEILIHQNRNERVLVTTLTKRMAEDLTEYYSDLGIRVRYLHSDISTLERIDIIRDLRMGQFDVLVGINLLREGLDIPEVSLVAILDADKEGFLRSTRSLIQTCGRASRNVRGKVIMYADVVTRSMKVSIDETHRRRKIQQAYNRTHNITPETIQKGIYPNLRFRKRPGRYCPQSGRGKCCRIQVAG